MLDDYYRLYAEWMGRQYGADGLTNEQWINVSRPGADPNLAGQYRWQNRVVRTDYYNWTVGKVDGKVVSRTGELIGSRYNIEHGPIDPPKTRSWYSIYNWPALGSSARTMDALYAGNYLEAGIQFLTCAAEVFTFGMASEINLGTKTLSSAAETSVASVDDLIVMMNKRAGVTAEYATGDALEYLNAVDARASHMLMEDGTSSILLRPDATRWDVMHEWLHRSLQVTNGGMTPGEDAFIESFLGRYQNYLRIHP